MKGPLCAPAPVELEAAADPVPVALDPVVAVPVPVAFPVPVVVPAATLVTLLPPTLTVWVVG